MRHDFLFLFFFSIFYFLYVALFICWTLMAVASPLLLSFSCVFLFVFFFLISDLVTNDRDVMAPKRVRPRAVWRVFFRRCR